VSKNPYAISGVKARWILDSRGNPTVEAEVVLECGVRGIAAAPSGASRGAHEALELRDGIRSEFRGKGVRKAIKNIEEVIAPALIGMDSRSQREIDQKMIDLDGTQQKTRLGANACLPVSLAVAKAAAAARKTPLYMHLREVYSIKRKLLMPIPLSNMINGGKHGVGLDIQEFLIIPSGVKSFAKAIQALSEIYNALGDIVSQRGLPKAVGDEGGYTCIEMTTEEALELLSSAVEESGYSLGADIVLGLDCAASQLYADGAYHVDGRTMDSGALIDWYSELASKYTIASIEDPLHEDDWGSLAALTKKMGDRIQVVGDDVFVSQAARLIAGAKQEVCNAILLKPNQVGTLTEAVDTAKTAFSLGYSTIVSHRSGETEDTFIADLAVALGCGQIKTGAPARGERTAKYNRLLRISEEEEIEYPNRLKVL